MKDDPDLQINDARSDSSTYSPKRRRIGSGDNKSLRILIVTLLGLVFAVGIIYFISKGLTSGKTSSLQLKVSALEQKIDGLEKQLSELQEKVSTSAPSTDLLQRVDALTQKVEELEKRKQPTTESKAKPSPPSKPAVSTEKQYHTVQKGETLYRISKKYGISVEELRKLNNLSAGQALRIGQRLKVSP